MSCSWSPTVEQVAAVLRSRTRGPASRNAVTAGEQGTFTDTTRPSAEQVAEIIDLAVGELVAMMGGRSPCTDELATGATVAATYKAAQIIEASYFPEQTNNDQTAFSGFQKLWESASKSVVASVVALCPRPTIPGGEDDGGALTPVGVVPRERLISRSWPAWS